MRDLLTACREGQARARLRLRPRDDRPSSEREAVSRVRSWEGAVGAAPTSRLLLAARPAPHGERMKAPPARPFVTRFAHSALDLKLRRMLHTCNAWCILSADEDPGPPEQHYVYDELGTHAINVTLRDRVRFFWHLVEETWP
jgi:hypothetical protein